MLRRNVGRVQRVTKKRVCRSLFGKSSVRGDAGILLASPQKVWSMKNSGDKKNIYTVLVLSLSEECKLKERERNNS